MTLELTYRPGGAVTLPDGRNEMAWEAGYARHEAAARGLQASRVAAAAADPSITLYPPAAAQQPFRIRGGGA